MALIIRDGKVYGFLPLLSHKQAGAYYVTLAGSEGYDCRSKLLELHLELPAALRGKAPQDIDIHSHPLPAFANKADRGQINGGDTPQRFPRESNF